MKLPAVVQTLLCRVGRHAWNRGRRVRGFLVRKCGACGLRQEQTFPGGDWRNATMPRTRVRKSDLEHQGSRAVQPEQDGAA